jgi:hypothetical protein
VSANPIHIDIDPDSELGHALRESPELIVLKSGDEQFRVTRKPVDLWADYDPDLVLRRLKEVSGKLSEEAAERYLEIVRIGRGAGSRPPARP